VYSYGNYRKIKTGVRLFLDYFIITLFTTTLVVIIINKWDRSRSRETC